MPTSQPTLFLICGLPGAGKTTLARQLERERPALRLTPDEWMRPLFGGAPAFLDRCRAPVEAVQWQVAARALELGVDVVLGFGFWSRAERDDFRARAAARRARAIVRYLDVPYAILHQRFAARNADLPPGTFPVTQEQLQAWARGFEPPADNELRE
jgi:predicted kinase